MSVINCSSGRLPRKLDVDVRVSIPQTEKTTSMTLAALLVESGNLPSGAGRLKIYSDSDTVLDEWGADSEAYKAARDFFAVTTSPTEFAIAQIFSTAQSGTMQTGSTGAVGDFNAISNGSFAISIDGVAKDVKELDFSSAASMADVANVIQTAFGDDVAATITYSGDTFIIKSNAAGEASSVSVLSTASPLVGTDISGPGLMNGRVDAASTQQGYTPGNIADEALLVQKAAGCQGKFIYGWLVEKSLRDSDNAVILAQWVESQDKAIFAPCSNSPLALNPSITTDISSKLKTLGLARTCGPQYHNQPDYYPDAALLAVALGVDYSAENSAITTKFKDFPGIPTVGVDLSEWEVLEGKGYQILSRTGNNSRVNREGNTENEAYHIDDRVNLDNLTEELQVAVYNVFLRNPKIPYSVTGQGLIEAGISVILNKYTRNGVLADRAVFDPTSESGVKIEPAFKVESGAIELATAADRAERKAPPVSVTVFLAGAIHSVRINVNAYT